MELIPSFITNTKGQFMEQMERRQRQRIPPKGARVNGGVRGGDLQSEAHEGVTLGICQPDCFTAPFWLPAAPACAGALAVFAPGADLSGSRPGSPGCGGPSPNARSGDLLFCKAAGFAAARVIGQGFSSNHTQTFHLCTAHGGDGNCLVKGRKPSSVLGRQGEQIKVRKLPRTVNALGSEKLPVT